MYFLRGCVFLRAKRLYISAKMRPLPLGWALICGIETHWNLRARDLGVATDIDREIDASLAICFNSNVSLSSQEIYVPAPMNCVTIIPPENIIKHYR